MPSLPTEWIGTFMFAQAIDGASYNFTIHFNLFGEVLEVENHFLELPLVARRLTAGDKIEQLVLKLESYEAQFPYFIPLAALGYMKDKQWYEIEGIIKEMQNGIVEGKFPRLESVAQSRWVKQAYILHRNPKKRWILSLLAPLFGEVHPKRCVALHDLYKLINPFIEPLFYAILPLQTKEAAIEYIYQGIADSGSEEAIDFLINQLTNLEDIFFQETILLALYYTTTSHPAIRDSLLNYYHHKRNLLDPEKQLPYLIGAFQNYSDLEVRNILWENLVSQYPEVAAVAFKCLRKLKVTESRIRKHLMAELKENASIQKQESVIRVFVSFTKKDLLPPFEEVLELFVQDCFHQKGYPFNSLRFWIKELIGRMLNDQTWPLLLELLEHRDIDVRKQTLGILKAKGESQHVDTVLAQLMDKNTNLQKEALGTLEWLIMKFEPSHVVDALLTFKANNDLSEEFMHARFIETFSWAMNRAPNPAGLPTLLSEIDHPSARIREAVARGLQGLDRPEVITVLHKLLKDSNTNVKSRAQESLNKIKQLQ